MAEEGLTRPRAAVAPAGGRYVAIILVALVVAVYLALQVVGLVFKLLFLLAVALIARATWRAWRTS